MMRILLFILVSVTICMHTNAQAANEAEKKSSYFASLSGGVGMMYGGLGSNFEIGTGHFSAFGAFGYAPKRVDGSIAIGSSFNAQGGVRYHFNVGNPFIFPRVGLGFGWITNYYDTRIKSNKYDHSVDGLSLQTGVAIYSREGIVFSFDLGMGSKLFVTNLSNHPYFYDFYIRPCIGIGYDIARLVDKEKGNRIQNKELNPFD